MNKDLTPLVAWRKESGLSQTAFWRRFGVTQSAGSRYESGRDIPLPIRLLVALHRMKRIDDGDLEQIRRQVERRWKPLPFLDWRKHIGMVQATFWPRYGVTQSGGSRYETGRIPTLPLRLLIALHWQKRISDGDLDDACAWLREHETGNPEPVIPLSRT